MFIGVLNFVFVLGILDRNWDSGNNEEFESLSLEWLIGVLYV